ncbi:MAG: sunset domain-containing protein [Aquihabitans sp.]
MREGKVRKLAALFGLGVLVGLLVKMLRGEPAPQFSNHPTVRGGPAVDPLLSPRPVAEPAPEDPTLAADAGTALVAAPDDPTVPAAETVAEPAPDPALESAIGQPELDLEPLVPGPEDPTVAAAADTALIADADAPGEAAAAAGEPTWVDPVDGACPDGYPIKAKVKSGIFHQPGGLAYERTNPDRCYPDAASAEADGLRAAKR